MLPLLACLLLAPTMVLASGMEPVPAAPQAAPAKQTAESVYNQGLAFKKANRWSDAEAAFRQATKLKPEFPEAWSELGHSLKKENRYDESVKAYQEALRLRPTGPQAMEYLGETYAYTGKQQDAQHMLDRLHPVEPTRDAHLEKVMS